jgi:uncharacterized membrane protein YkvA (DUF1232 family)
MPVTITFDLSDKDLEHFQAMAREAQQAVKTAGLSHDHIVAAARGLFDASRDAERLPDFIAERLAKLEVLVRMVSDEEWKLPEEELGWVLSAMAYFADPEDLIPDRVPGIGFLDDAIMAELVAADLEEEISAYLEFDGFRVAEEQRRENQGLPTHVAREDWLADKRAVLHHRMRERRRARADSGLRSIRLW